MLVKLDTGPLFGEGLIVGVVWGIPLWLTVRAWRLSKKHQSGGSTWLATSCLVLSEAFLLLVGILVAIEAIKAFEVPFSLQGVGVLNLLLCGIALTSSLLRKSAWPPQVRRAVMGASVYMIFVWLFAVSAR